MNRVDLENRVRGLTRDFSNSIFRKVDIRYYINEAIDRIRQVVPELVGMKHLNANEDVPILLPSQYHHLLTVYTASRCFAQDERHYQSTTYMNEFEVKLEELKSKIEAGQVVIIDPATGEAIEDTYEPDYVVDNYFFDNEGVD